MKEWKCKKCGNIYKNMDTQIRDGLPNGSMLATMEMLDAEESLDNIPFEDLPPTWVCPVCQSSKDEFEAVVEKKSISSSNSWVCDPCGYVYNPSIGDPDQDIPPGTKFNDLPEDWVCPLCGAPKEEFTFV